MRDDDHRIAGFDSSLQLYATKKFNRDGITVKPNHHILEVKKVITHCFTKELVVELIALLSQNILVVKEEGEGI